MTNEKPQEVRNIVVPEGASEEEQMAALQRAMEEEARNKQREADEEARRAAAAKAPPLPCRVPLCLLARFASPLPMLRSPPRPSRLPPSRRLRQPFLTAAPAWRKGGADRAV